MKTIKSNLFHQCRGCLNMYNTKKKAEECYDSHLVRRCISCLKEFETDADSIVFDHYKGCSLHVKDTCGYGSEHDMTKVDFVVCTECMEKFLSYEKNIKV